MKKAIVFMLALVLLISACSTSRQKLSPQGNLNLKSANVYFTQKDNDKSLEKALALYDKVLSDNPNHVIALKRTADINFLYATQIEPSAKGKDKDKVYQNMDKAVKTIGYYTVTYGKYDSVLTVMSTFTKLNEDDRAMKRDAQKKKEASWARIFNIGQLLLETEDFTEAANTFELAHRLDPSKPEPLRKLVAVYQLTKDEAKTEYYLNQVLAADPDDPDLIKMMGAHHYNKKEYDKAIVYFKKTQVTFPIDTNNLLLLAASYSELKQYQNALDTFVKVLKFEPDNQDALFSAKELARVLNNTTAEMEYLKHLVALDPSINNLEEYCLRMVTIGNYEGLMSYSEQWFEKDPTSLVAASSCALIASKIGRKDLEKKYNDLVKQLSQK